MEAQLIYLLFFILFFLHRIGDYDFPVQRRYVCQLTFRSRRNKLEAENYETISVGLRQWSGRVKVSFEKIYILACLARTKIVRMRP